MNVIGPRIMDKRGVLATYYSEYTLYWLKFIRNYK